ncbi:MAG: DICT sensory domain-containing protein [Microcoleaceae cyanobacterium]
MIIPTSVLTQLLQIIPQLRPQLYFKSSLTALSHAMEDQVLAGTDQPLVIASFQRERFYRQEAHRYRRIAQRTSQVYVLASPETEFKNSSEFHETIAFEPGDGLCQEWHLLVIGQDYCSCLICQEREGFSDDEKAIDQFRRFEGIWTFDSLVTSHAAELLLNRILIYRPELASKIAEAKSRYLLESGSSHLPLPISAKNTSSADPFVLRLVTYLQAGQYKLLKAYRAISAQEQKERLLNLITSAMRRSLNPQEMLEVAVTEIGDALGSCRCLIYRCKATDTTATIHHESLRSGVTSVFGQSWPLQNNPLFPVVVEKLERVYLSKTTEGWQLQIGKGKCKGHKHELDQISPDLEKSLRPLLKQYFIQSWLMVPVLYQGRLLGIVELHQCNPSLVPWDEDELTLVDAIATQLGAALIQAETYAHLEELNQQLEALDRTRSNLIAITGHELRTPLSTIQVCLESLTQEPDMPEELRQVMLDTALGDAERMRKLIQDFLTLSHLESGRVQWRPESLSLEECIELALSSIRARHHGDLPKIITDVSPDLPLVHADGEWLVEVLTKLLDNAYKFTQPQGQISIQAKTNGNLMVEVSIVDTGRGIEPNRLEVVFDRFYQEEGALRRSAGGTGLGLAICRQIVTGWGGQIWANSPGKDQGSEFHFTIPVVQVPKKSKSKNKR